MHSDDISGRSAFEKRLKRRIISRRHKFFVAAAPGFEALCCDELRGLSLVNPKIDVCEGGVEFQGHVHECYLANLRLHTASRILMRIHEFKSSNFRQFEKKLADIDWELYFLPDTTPQIRVSTKNSRLFHKQAIAEKVVKSISTRLSDVTQTLDDETTPRYDQTVFIRGVNDCFSLSLDSSGQLLYKRGIKTHGGKAPVRETIAAAALRLSGYTGEEPLVDPMCGSGTFSIEGALMVNQVPAGWHREFGFMAWPFFRRQRWEYIRKQAWNGEVKSGGPVIFASDQDRHACGALKNSISRYLFSSSIQVRCRDFFDLMPDNIDKQHCRHSGLLVVNPPYGLRMGDRNSVKHMIPEILKKLFKDFKGWKLAMIMPDKVFIDKVPYTFKAYPFFHGGLNLHLIIGKI